MQDDIKKIIGWAILGLLVIVVFTLTLLCDYGIICTTSHHLSCDDSKNLKANTVFLLDFSDPVTDETAELIKQEIREHQDKIKVGGKLTLLRITSNLYKTDYEICKPINPNDLIRNKNWSCDRELRGIDKPREKERDQFCKFTNEMDDMISRINEQAKASLSSSPLIESLSEISQREDFTAEKTRRIVLFSDLLQNTDKYSFYPNRGVLPVANEVIENNNINLSNVEIRVHHIERKQSVRVRKFWTDFFQQAMANEKTTTMQN